MINVVRMQALDQFGYNLVSILFFTIQLLLLLLFQTCAGLEQYAIQKFAESLEVIPRTLAENAGVKATELISKLYAAHQGGDKNAGFDNEVHFDL